MRNIAEKVLWGLKIRGVQVILLLTLYFMIADSLPITMHQGLYTMSLLIKDLLIWILPVTVGLFIAQALCSFQQRAPLFIFALVLFEAFSNLSSVWYAYGAGHLAVDFLPPPKLIDIDTHFQPLWRLPLLKPTWWAADKGVFVGAVIGCLIAVLGNESLKKVLHRGKDFAQWILTNFFARLIPIFVLGFVAHMYQTKILQQVFSHYGVLIIWLVAFLSIYLFLLFFIGNGLSFKTLFRRIKNLMPAGGIAFTSGCSLSTMPWTIEGTSKNLQEPHLAQSVIPATTNIQQIGDCITNTFLCFLIYNHFFGHVPDFYTWSTFSIVFVLARFATAAVIGGAIFIMLPIYESFLNFNAEMIALILAFNVVLDPLVTSCNVIANGALCSIFEKVWRMLITSPWLFAIKKRIRKDL